MNGLKIFTENWLNEHSDILCSSGDTNNAYLCDQKQDTKWASESSNDATQETIEIVFNNWQGAEVDRNIDRIIFLNHNLKAGGVDYWSAGAWVEIAEATFTGLASAYTFIELTAPVVTSRIRVRLDTTQTANEDKEIGELKFCEKILDGTQLWRSDIPRSDSQLAGTYRTGEGRLVFWREWTKFAASGYLQEVTLANKNTLLPYLKSGGFITIVFYQDFDPTECFECALVEGPRFSLDRKSELFEVSLNLEER